MYGILYTYSRLIPMEKLFIDLYLSGQTELADQFFTNKKDEINLSILTEMINDRFHYNCNGKTTSVEQMKYLIAIGEKYCDKIDIHKYSDRTFQSAVFDIEKSKYLIHLGENGYGKFDIHADKEYAFFNAIGKGCFHKENDNDPIEYLEWLIGLGENGYGKFDVVSYREHHLAYDIIFRLRQPKFVKWLFNLRQRGYDVFDHQKCSKYCGYMEMVHESQKEELEKYINILKLCALYGCKENKSSIPLLKPHFILVKSKNPTETMIVSLPPCQIESNDHGDPFVFENGLSVELPFEKLDHYRDITFSLQNDNIIWKSLLPERFQSTFGIRCITIETKTYVIS